MAKLFLSIYFGLVVAGICDSIYTAWEYTSQNFNSCSLKHTIWSCSAVAMSGHTSVFGIPFWITGVVWFPVTFVVSLVAFKYAAEVVLIPYLMIGNIFSVYLWYLELEIIHYICPVCVSLYLVNYALTGLALWTVIRQYVHLSSTTPKTQLIVKSEVI